MVISKKEILDLLKKGSTIDEIADEVANTLNEALKDYDVDKKQKEKIEAMDEILCLFHDFFIDFYCETEEDEEAVHKAFCGENEAEKYVEVIDNVYSLKKAFSDENTEDDIIKLFTKFFN